MTRKTGEEMHQILRDVESKDIEINGVYDAAAYFGWGADCIGFGQMSFSLDKDSGKFKCMNECMSKEFVRKTLHSLADHIADNVILEDERK